MSVRTWLNEHSAAAAGIVIALLAVALVIIYQVMKSSPPKAWYFDTGNGQLFAAAHEPSAAPSGKEAVRAYVFGCGGCDQAQRKVGYIERVTEAGRRATGTARIGTPEHEAIIPGGKSAGGTEAVLALRNEGHLVALPQDQKWVSVMSDEGMALIEKAGTCPDGKAAERCLP